MDTIIKNFEATPETKGNEEFSLFWSFQNSVPFIIYQKFD